MEQLTAGSWVAAKTSKTSIVLADMVVPHRPAVVAAKQLATIDVLSGGRLVAGRPSRLRQCRRRRLPTMPAGRK